MTTDAVPAAMLLPVIWELPAGTGDVLTGLFAVPAAIALATGTAEGRKAAILWNIFGFADLAVAITLGMIISPGPFQLIVPNILSIGIDGYPNVLTPAFALHSWCQARSCCTRCRGANCAAVVGRRLWGARRAPLPARSPKPDGRISPRSSDGCDPRSDAGE